MKIKQLIPLGAAACLSFAAVAQQQSPFGTPAVATQVTPAGGPIVLNLSGVTVTDAAGQPVGPIQHILLSPAGCVDMAVLSLGGQKLVPVPWTLVTGTGAARAETEVAGGATLALKVDRTVLQQAPTVTVAQLSQPQTMVQIRQFFTQVQQQQGTAAGGTTSQTDVNVGVGANTTNRTTTGLTNAATGNTNQTGILSPTGPTNAAPGRPAFETNRPGRPSIIPPGRENRPPYNRPPTNTPPTTPRSSSGTGTAAPNNPGQPIQQQPQ